MASCLSMINHSRMDKWHAVVSHQRKVEWMDVWWCLQAYTRTNLSDKSKWIFWKGPLQNRDVSSPMLMIRNSCWQVNPGHGRIEAFSNVKGMERNTSRSACASLVLLLCPPFSPPIAPRPPPLTMPVCHFISAGGISHYQEGKWDCIEKQWEFDLGLCSLGDYFELVTASLSNNLLKAQTEWMI